MGEIVTEVLFGDEVKRVDGIVPDVDKLVAITADTNRISLIQRDRSFNHVIGAFDESGEPIAAGVVDVPKDVEEPLVLSGIYSNGHEPEVTAEAKELVMKRASGLSAMMLRRAGVIVDLPEQQ